MAKNNAVNDFIESVKSGTDGLVAVSVVEVASGMTLGAYSDGSLDPDVASAYNVEVVKAKLKAIKALGLKESIDDILITLSSQYHLINLNEDGSYMIYLAAHKDKANLAILRNTLKQGMSTL
ncbi:hypothetical protein SAMN04488029_3926 [Reichenbachiella faecimaris]|uniref:Roadblock/LAMTOR2 domain-containing protein n=1 Tax=Reichenbachiella faecimaris TaxID=692418 RepID=A0A1W2GQE9_REIFA|nr:hypothetical protein [Reichenbachiella faecimaris]SMD38883.1 hypothetical protein SAMN04488029_3926 [Reichenbachiella faecimaris]